MIDYLFNKIIEEAKPSTPKTTRDEIVQTSSFAGYQTSPNIIFTHNDDDFIEQELECDECNGTGIIAIDYDNPIDAEFEECYECEGTGLVYAYVRRDSI